MPTYYDSPSDYPHRPLACGQAISLGNMANQQAQYLGISPEFSIARISIIPRSVSFKTLPFYDMVVEFTSGLIGLRTYATRGLVLEEAHRYCMCFGGRVRLYKPGEAFSFAPEPKLKTLARESGSLARSSSQ